MFCNCLLHVPGAIEVLREDDQVAGAEAYRILAVRYSYLAIQYQARLLLCV